MKSVNNFCSCFLIIVFGVSCSSKEEKLIVGSWKAFKKELRDGETGEKVTLDGKPYVARDYLIFQNNGVVFDKLNKLTFEYSMKDNLLFIGNRTYIVEKLTNTEFVMLSYSKDSPNDPFAFRYYFKKE